MAFKAVIFDWNGTLLDDTLIWHAALRETFRAFNAKAPTIEEYFRALKQDYLDVYRMHGITATREELHVVYDSAYRTLLHQTVLDADAKHILDELSDLGIPMYLVTMQLPELVEPLLEKFGIHDHFADRLYRVIRKDDVIKNIARDIDISPKDCLAVGDAPADIRHANRAGVTSVAYLSGHIPRELFSEDSKPDHTITRLKELVALIRSSCE